MADETEELNINMESAVADISRDLAGDLGSEAPKPDGGVSSPPAGAAPPTGAAPPPATRTVPKSWTADMHPFWEKLDPKVQEYWERRESEMAKGVEPLKTAAAYAHSIQQAVQPYKRLLEAQGLQEDKAIQYLMNGHVQLCNPDKAKRMAFARQLLHQYQIDEKEFGTVLANEAPLQDPTLQPVLERLTRVEGMLTQGQRQQVESARSYAMEEVEAFAGEVTADGTPAHPYFDEVADDIVLHLQNPKISLAEAYERAIYANPVTRAKELARLRQQDAVDIRKKAEEEARKAAAAKGTQLRGADVRSPQEPLGSIDETLNATMRDIKSRTAA